MLTPIIFSTILYSMLFSPLLLFRKVITINGMIIFSMSLLLLFFFSTINASFNFIEDKVASDVAYRMYDTGSFTLTFYLQYLLAYVGFVLANDTHVTFGLNIVLQSYFFLLAYETLIKKCKMQLFLLILLLLFPSFYHYSIFGLRDPLVNLLSLFFILLSIKPMTFPVVLGYLLLLLSCIFSRPELCIIFLVLIGLRLFLISSLFIKALLVGVSIVALNFALYGAMSTLGIKGANMNIVENIEKLNKFNEARNNRRVGGEGGGSAVLGGKLFQLPFYQRYPVQISATILVPLPHEFRGVTSWLGLLDSMFFISAIIMALKFRDNKRSTYFLLCGIIYLLIIALFTMNYGNTLRMRYPIFIFFFASFCYSDRLKRFL